MEQREVWLICHGEAFGDETTDRGQHQVRAAATAHLPRIDNWRTYGDGSKLLTDTANIAMSALDISIVLQGPRGLSVYEATHSRDRDFGWNWRLDDGSLPSHPFNAIENELTMRHGKAMTAFHILDAWAPASALRERLTQAILRVAKLSLADPVCEGHILVATRSPLGELAAPIPRAAPRLLPGDIMQYTVEVTHLDGRITGAKHYRCPNP